MSKICVDGNVACAKIAYQLNEVSAIYPITPSSAMAEACDEMANAGEKNIFGEQLKVVEMQSEAGVAGAVHGSLKAGALTTTFTCSQGLLLMIPNMFKIAGELLPTVFHVSARAIATHALSIFGDHSDVMSARSTGFLMLSSSSVQEAHDMALISHIASLKTSLPFIHFFDGFRTSHEIQKIDQISKEQILKLLPKKEIADFKNRALNPNKPYQAGTAQNPDVFFQNREAINKYYQKSFDTIVDTMNEVGKVIGRNYKPFEYYGDKDAENIIVIMGSGAETCEETIETIINSREQFTRLGKIGVLKVRVYRPFNVNAFINALPATTKRIAVLDRTKESGAIGEPLYLDVVSALSEAGKSKIKVWGGRYGLGSKEFKPNCVIAVLENLTKKSPKNHFTVGIEDDVTNLSLSTQTNLVKIYKEIEDKKSEEIFEFMFYGLGSDGTVSANKNSIKIIGESSNKYVQGFFEYDSKKSGSLTVSHLRVSSKPIKRAYEIERADFIAVHNFSFLNKFDVLKTLVKGGTVLLNTVLSEDELNTNLPIFFKEELLKKKAKLYIINAQKIATELGLGNKINIIMQSAFFKTSNIINYEKAKEEMIKAVRKTYGRKGDEVIQANEKAVLSSEFVKQVDTKKLNLDIDYKEVVNKENACIGECDKCSVCTIEEKRFYDNIMKSIEVREGNELPVSVFSADGSIPTDTAKFEKRGIALMCPKWGSDECIQCGRCVMVCPHAALRAVLVDEKDLKDSPKGFVTKDAMGVKGAKYRIQLSPLDCTGCGVCANVCPARQKALVMTPSKQIFENEVENYEYSQTLPRVKSPFNKFTTKGMQFEKPYFEFSGACAGCGETPYIKLATQMFGKNMIIANATGCSSIYGGSFPSCPYAKDDKGRGPAWANSLFEDNAEFGMGMSLAVQTKKTYLKNLVQKLDLDKFEAIKEDLTLWKENQNALSNEKVDELIENLKQISAKSTDKQTIEEIIQNSDAFYKKSVWIIGGDGWAYDIGYGGLDHVLNSKENVNILVLDSEVYSNTGGQSSKATPSGAVAKFASGGKETHKKDLALLAVMSKNAYVAKISMGANYEQTIKALREAEEFDGPSIIIAYTPCVNHGLDMSKSQTHMRDAVASGYWDLFRYNPTTNTLTLDSEDPTMPYEDFITQETRYSSLAKANPEKAKILFEKSKQEAIERRRILQILANK
jgi:pyruvate-ferredoxin/flavodoxin oxidoreductase